VFTVKQVAALMTAGEKNPDYKILPSVAIAFFAGLSDIFSRVSK
jgi:hypothetical protein